ncbi:hypothetical protein NTH33_004022 [Vibrio mimicus]
MISDSLNSIKAFLYDRTVSPLFGALITAYIVWNFKILMLVTSKDNYAIKEWEFNNFYSSSFFKDPLFFGSIDLSWATNYLMCLFVMPIISALLYIYVFPYPSKWVFSFSYKKQVELSNEKKAIQGTALITVEEKAELLAKYDRAKIEQKEQSAVHRSELEEVERQVSQLIGDKSQLEARLSEYESNSDYLDQIGELKSQLEDTRRENTQLEADLEGCQRKLEQLSLPVPLKDTPLKQGQEPGYLRFYQGMSATEQSTLANVLRVLLRGSLDQFDLLSEVWADVNSAEGETMIQHLALYDVISIDTDVTNGAIYPMISLTETGRELYRHILENPYALAS